MLFQQTLPREYGFKSMKETLEMNPVTHREGEGED